MEIVDKAGLREAWRLQDLLKIERQARELHKLNIALARKNRQIERLKRNQKPAQVKEGWPGWWPSAWPFGAP